MDRLDEGDEPGAVLFFDYHFICANICHGLDLNAFGGYSGMYTYLEMAKSVDCHELFEHLLRMGADIDG